MDIYSIIKKNSLSLSDDKKLTMYIESKGCEYLSTPFCIEAANFLNKIGVKAFKIGSGEFNNLPLIEKICSFKKPMILSTGMNSRNSIRKIVDYLNKKKAKYILNYCVNLYPTPIKLINLNEIKFLNKISLNKIIGYSDHTIGLNAPISSFFFGAQIVEKHFCLNKKNKGPDIPCSMDAQELKSLINSSKEMFSLHKNKKTNLKHQKVTSDFAFHSLVSSRNLSKGTKIIKKYIEIKRPGTGNFTAKDSKKILNKKQKLNIKKNTQFKYEHFN